ncbi:hypothetical protein CLV59_11031 [Chitinophaga dinghuensis]|uniref:Uncharacterized protein n=1 Tax=Chitinophaga dinghuensis TaxID=1539050 RepID=A0A327VM97_9BACT|nr:hypothetical protein [Chitinophaga dinghuensis]RAJ74985.1 hypothetical protein CLV59_11031 [Chitinophaga dinghuensis]
MGHRVNYVIKDGEELHIYYNHWHVNLMTGDMYKGENAFIDFVMSCEKHEELMSYNWMEGCVILDIRLRQLYFWYDEYPHNTSVMECYVLQLSEKWPQWGIQLLKNRMYDGEKILGVDYISQQSFGELHRFSKEFIVADEMLDKYNRLLVLIKSESGYFVTATRITTPRGILYNGTDSIDLLRQRPAIALPLEQDVRDCIIIDTERKHILFSNSDLGAWEQTNDNWPGYTFEMGDYGYIKTLRMSGIDGEHLRMSEEEIKEEVDYLKNLRSRYDGNTNQ